jgi:hypothetical protein
MLQVVRQTFEERYNMYFKNKKEILLVMYNERLRQRGQKDEMSHTLTKAWLANWLAKDEVTHNPDACKECECETADLPGYSYSISTES